MICTSSLKNLDYGRRTLFFLPAQDPKQEKPVLLHIVQKSWRHKDFVLPCASSQVSHLTKTEISVKQPAQVISRDFSDYGFSSTYLCSKAELRLLFDALLADALYTKPDYVIFELSGGMLQRENRLILEDDSLQRRIDSVVLTSSCSLAALEGVRRLQSYGHNVAAVTGTLSHSPLHAREFCAQTEVPVAYLKDTENELANLVQRQLLAQKSAETRPSIDSQ